MSAEATWPPPEFATQPALRARLRRRARGLGLKARTRAELARWRPRLRARLREITGLDSFRPVPLAPRLDRPVRCEGYTRTRATICTEAGVRMPFFILVPDGVDVRHPAAAVIAPHGHGSGGKVAVCGVADRPEIAEAIERYNYAYGVALVRRGFRVFAPDARGFGERREVNVAPAHLSGSCQHLSNMALPLGCTVTGMWTFDLMRLVDYILTRGDVLVAGGPKIGCAGLSGGGLQALWLAALDDRIAAAVVSGYFYGYGQSLFEMHLNCACNYVPHLYEVADMGDLGALIAPRPLLIETGDRDGLNGAGGLSNVRSQVVIARRAYRLAGAPRNFVHDIFEGGHKWHGQAAVPFLQQHLQPRASNVPLRGSAG